MISKRIAVKLLQMAALAGIVLWGGTTPVRADDWCPTQSCESCPADWFGSCYAGIEGCEVYNCFTDGECTIGGSVTYYQCYCPPCN